MQVCPARFVLILREVAYEAGDSTEPFRRRTIRLLGRQDGFLVLLVLRRVNGSLQVLGVRIGQRRRGWNPLKSFQGVRLHAGECSIGHHPEGPLQYLVPSDAAPRCALSIIGTISIEVAGGTGTGSLLKIGG